MSIEVRHLNKKFGQTVVCDNLNLDIPAGELVALLGPSGSGKTTLLRIIAGLEVADSGTVMREGEDITQQSARDRKIGFVFQHYALFRHMTVEENIGYGLRVRKRPKELIRERVGEQVVVMNQGRIEQFGTPAEVFERPANPFVMDFLGNVNVFHGRVEQGKAVVAGAELGSPDDPHAESEAAAVYVRPHEVVIQH